MRMDKQFKNLISDVLGRYVSKNEVTLLEKDWNAFYSNPLKYQNNTLVVSMVNKYLNDEKGIEIIAEYPQKNYTLVKRINATYEPFVACYRFDKTDYTWGQGHYFNTVESARKYIESL